MLRKKESRMRGAMINREDYLQKVVPSLGMDSIAQDLSEYLGISLREAKWLAEKDAKDASLRQEWSERSPKINEEEVRAFYSKSQAGYLFSHALADRYFYNKYLTIHPYLRGKKILDYGAGNGTISLLISRLDKMEVTAADVESEHAKFAAFRFQKYDTGIEQRFFGTKGYPKGRWDTILCLDVLEHCADWKGVLRWAYESLNDGGRFLLTLSFSLYEEGALHITDRSGLNPRRFREEAEQIGFGILKENQNEFYVLVGAG